MVFKKTLLRRRAWAQGRVYLPRSKRVPFGTLVGQTLLRQERVVRVPNLVLDKTYLMPLLDTYTWTYTLPNNSIGAFVRLFTGVFMRQGSLLGLLKILNSCARAHPVQPEGSYEISYPSFIAYPQVTGHFPPASDRLKVDMTTNFVKAKPQSVRKAKPAKFGRRIKKLLRFPLRQLKAKVRSLAKPSRRGYKKVTGPLRPALVFQRGVSWPVASKVKYARVLRRPSLGRRFKRFNVCANTHVVLARGLMLTREPAFPAPNLSHQNLHFWNCLHKQPTLTYSLKYCRLSRRVRKILKNKYRYAKYFFMIAPYKRRLYTLHLWKYVLQFHDERSLSIKLNELFKNFTNPDSESLLWSLFYIQQRLTLKKLLGR